DSTSGRGPDSRPGSGRSLKREVIAPPSLGAGGDARPGRAQPCSNDCAPSIHTSVPLMWLAASEARNATSSPTCSEVPGFFPVSGIGPRGNSTGILTSSLRASVLSEISVSIAPGQMTLTRIPRGPSSTASIFAIAIWPAFEAEYAVAPLLEKILDPLTEDVTTTEPPRRMCGTAALIVTNVPTRLISI